MTCPTCGAENLSNAAFCSQCATNLLIPPHLAVARHLGTRTSGMAIAGFVLSFFCGLLGLIFSILGYNESRRSNGAITGEGLALAGIIISLVSMLAGVAIYGGRL